MRYFYLFLATLLLFSTSVESKEKEAPSWVKDPNCLETQFCSVGIGNSEKEARTDARTGLVKIFSTHVESKFSSSLSSENDKVSSSDSYDSSEKTKGYLKASEIKSMYQKDETYYVLAILDKIKASQIVLKDLGYLDDEIAVLIEDDSPYSANKASALFEERKLLNEQLIVLTGKSRPSFIDFEEVFKNKKIKTKTVFLVFQNKVPLGVKKVIKEVLIKNGYTVSMNAEFASSLKVSLEKEQLPFDIQGLEKYDFILSLITSSDETFDFQATGIGISENQALKEALRSLKKEFSEEIENIVF